jgi:hypothetical protein
MQLKENLEFKTCNNGQQFSDLYIALLLSYENNYAPK